MKATLTKIDKNGNQLFKTDNLNMLTIWLCGIDRAKDVKVGDTGRMVYFSTMTRGYYHFIKEGYINEK